MMYVSAYEKPQSVKSEDPHDDEKNRKTQMKTNIARIDESQSNKRGMILPFEPHSIVFDDVIYSVDMPQVGHLHCKHRLN